MSELHQHLLAHASLPQAPRHAARFAAAFAREPDGEAGERRVLPAFFAAHNASCGRCDVPLVPGMTARTGRRSRRCVLCGTVCSSVGISKPAAPSTRARRRAANAKAAQQAEDRRALAASSHTPAPPVKNIEHARTAPAQAQLAPQTLDAKRLQKKKRKAEAASLAVPQGRPAPLPVAAPALHASGAVPAAPASSPPSAPLARPVAAASPLSSAPPARPAPPPAPSASRDAPGMRSGSSAKSDKKAALRAMLAADKARKEQQAAAKTAAPKSGLQGWLDAL